MTSIQSSVLEGLHVYHSGDPRRPGLLLLHGSPLSGRMWTPQLERLEEFYCLAPDLPEHGQSQAVAPFTMDDAVRRLAAIVRTTAEGRAHVVGLSFGGVVAQALMVQQPELVDHVILTGTSGRMGGALLQLMRLSLALNRPLLRRLSPRALAALARWQTGIPATRLPLIEDDMKRVDPDSLTRFILATYAGVTTPATAHSEVLVLVGEKETLVSKRMARRLQREIPGARGATVRRVGHVWNLEQPDLFAEVVRRWISDRPLPDALNPFS